MQSSHTALKSGPDGNFQVFARGGVGGVSLNSSFGVAVHPVTGDIYIFDTFNHRIVQFSPPRLKFLIADAAELPRVTAAAAVPD